MGEKEKIKQKLVAWERFCNGVGYTIAYNEPDSLLQGTTGMEIASAAHEQHCLETDGLTGREKEVYVYMFQGRTAAEIAILLSISHRTVEKHVQNIYRKLGIRSKKELLAGSTRGDR